MEKVSVEALQALEGELHGQYHPLDGMTPDTQQKLTADHFLFNDSDRYVDDDQKTIKSSNDHILFFQKQLLLSFFNNKELIKLFKMYVD